MKNTLLTAGFLGVIVCANAATKTWDGSSSGNWATGANWAGGTAPVAGDDLVFPAGVAQLLTTNNFSPNRAFNSITFLGSNYVVRGSALMLANGIRVGTPGGNNANHTFDTIVADIQVNADQSFFVTNVFTELVVQGDIALSANTLTLDGDGTETIFGAISGTGGAINKDGFGIVNFETNNSFTGGCIIYDGRIRAKEPLSLGTTAGGTTVYSSGMLELQARFTNEVLTLSGGTLFVNTSPGRWVGTINVVSNSSILTAGDFFVDGAVTGTGNLTVDAALAPLRGEVDLVGSQNNTYSGTLQLLDGVLVLGKAPGFTALSGPLIVGTGGTFNPTNAVVLYAGNNQISSGNVTINQDATLDLNGNSDLIGSLTMIGGVVTNTGSGFLQLGGNVKATSVSGGPARIRGQINLGTAARTFFVTNGPSSSDLEIDRRVFGAFNLFKDEAGVMSLLVSNSFDGIVHVQGGRLQVDDDFAFGTLGGDRVVVHDGATLSLLAGADNIAQNLALNGNGDGGSGALLSFGTVSWNGDVTLASDSLINVASGTLTIAGQIGGAGGFSKTGTGTLRLSGTSNNVYEGDTTLRAGVLELSKTSAFAISNSASLFIGDESDNENADTVRYGEANQLRTTVGITINRTGVLDLNGFTDDVGSINMIGGTIQTGAGVLQLRGNLTAIGDVTPGSPLSTFDACVITGTLDLGAATRTFTVNNNSFFGGLFTDLVVDAVITGAGGSLTKSGAGELSLGGNNTYTGSTTINAGSIIVANGSAFGTSSTGTTVNNPGFIEMQGGFTVVSEPLTLNNSASPVALLSSSGNNAWNGPITLTQTAGVNVLTNSALTFGGAISGAGGLTKIGSGKLTFAGSAANGYTGDTVVNEGVLELAKASAVSSMNSGKLIIGDGVGAIAADVVRYLDDNQILVGTAIIVNDTGRLDLNNFSDTLGTIALIGGQIDTGTGTLTMNADVTATSTALTDADITGNLNLGAATRTFTVTNGNQAQDLQISAAVRGSGGFTKDGAGRLSLLSSNSYSGLTTVNDGVLRMYDAFALGTTAAGTVLNGDSILELSGPFSAGAEELTNNSIGQSGFAISNLTDTNSWAGTITLLTNTGISVTTNTSLNLSGVITGAGGVTKSGPGTLMYSGGAANNYAGVTTVDAGTLVLAKTAANGALTNDLVIGDGAGGANADLVIAQGTIQLPNTVAVTVSSSGLFQLDEGQEDFGSLAGTGNVLLNHSGGIEIGFDDSSTTFSGVISGIGSLTKSGNGTMTLSGNNTYAGATIANAGTLLVNGSQPQSPVTVGGSGTLGGTGTVGVIVGNGNVAPGASPGTLTSSNLTFSATGDFFVELTGPTAGTDYDQLNVHGTNNLASAILHVNPVFTKPVAVGQQFIIITNDSSDPITGTFSGLPENSGFTAGGFGFRINYAAGSGNDVVLTLTNIPSDFFFTNLLGGDFFTAPNWFPNLVPGTANNANFTNNASYTITWSTNATNANAFFNAASGIITQSLGGFSWQLTNSYIIGQNAGATASVTHNSGTLRVTNAAAAALLEVRRGTNRLNAGAIDDDRLLLTNTAGVFEFNGGTLNVRTSTVANGKTFFVGNGTSAGTLSLTGGGTHSFANGLTIRSNAALIGNGSITGAVTVLNGGVIAPGTSIGKIILSASPSLSGSLVFEISKNGATLVNDQIQVTGAVNFGGTLTVTNIGPGSLGLGDRFVPISAGSYAGGFSSITLPPLAAGLVWTNKLLLDGSLQVTAATRPRFTSTSLSGTNLILSGSNGVPNSTYTVLASTNVALPISIWGTVATGVFDGAGNFNFTNAISPVVSHRFYVLQMP